VDTVGCPFDEDADGVPDYLDKELDTPPGTWVDDDGVTLSESDFLESLSRDTALLRDDLDAYLALIEYKYEAKKVTEIPENFVPLDTDEDGYISFDELLKVIDDYFDFSVDLSLDELRQVNEFFFSQ
jgi:Ca2+-binding EF-hand superfamily protein